MTAPTYCQHCNNPCSANARFCNQCGHQTVALAGQYLGQQMTTPASALTVGHQLAGGHYTLLKPLGTGGFGEVWLGEDTYLQRQIAIKRLSVAGLSGSDQQAQIQSFQKEARLLARLRHDRLPTVMELITDGEDWFMIMDYIEGQNLEDGLNQRLAQQATPFSLQETLLIGKQLCAILSYLHSQQPQIIFRDIKPANIIQRASDGKICLIDFGIARLYTPGQAKDTASFGSPGYAAPEQFGRAQTSVRSDIYSLGVTLFELMTGLDPNLKPFSLPTQHVADPGLRQLITQMVKMDESERPSSMTEVSQTLELLQARQAQTPVVRQFSLSSNQNQWAMNTTIQPCETGLHIIYPATSVQNRRSILLVHSRKDMKYAEGIETALAMAKRKYGLTIRSTQKLTPGQKTIEELISMVQGSCAILPIISYDFLSGETFDRWCNLILPNRASDTQIFPVYARLVDLDPSFPDLKEIVHAREALPKRFRDGTITSISEMNRDEAGILIGKAMNAYCDSFFGTP